MHRNVERLIGEHVRPQRSRFLALLLKLRHARGAVVDGASKLRVPQICEVVEWREHVAMPDEVDVQGRRVQQVLRWPARVSADQRHPIVTVATDCIGDLQWSCRFVCKGGRIFPRGVPVYYIISIGGENKLPYCRAGNAVCEV